MPDTSNRGVNWPQAWRFQGLLDQSEKTSAGLAAGAGIAKRFGEAGTMLKSLAGTALVDSAALPAVAVLVSFLLRTDWQGHQNARCRDCTPFAHCILHERNYESLEFSCGVR